MEVLGIISLTILILCLITFFSTGIKSWLTPVTWCIPMIGLGFFAPKDAEINGLVVVLCFSMIASCYGGINKIRMWNFANRKKPYKSATYILIYIFVLASATYSYIQSQYLGYIMDIQGLTRESIGRWTYISSFIIYPILAYSTSNLIYNSIDKFFSRKNDFVLLQCRTFHGYAIGSRSGGIIKQYYLDGINKGLRYHFRLTLKSYYILRREERIRIRLNVGCFGGLYVLQNISIDDEKRAIKINKWIIQRTTIVCIISAVLTAGCVLAKYFYFK